MTPKIIKDDFSKLSNTPFSIVKKMNQESPYITTKCK